MSFYEKDCKDFSISKIYPKVDKSHRLFKDIP